MRDGPTGDLRTTFGAAGALTTATLPVFLLGALSDQVRADLGIDEAGIGAAITVLFLTVGVVAGPVGRLTERLGARFALRGGVVVSALATATVGLVATSWWHVAVAFVVVAVALAAIDTGAARTFADAVAPDRQGAAFGIKEASVPTASLLAGVALPTVGVALGWRGAFVAALLVAVVVLALLPRGAVSRGPVVGASAAGDVPVTAPSIEGQSRRRLWTFAVAVGLGAAGANAAAAFLAPAMGARGAAPALAGATLVVASAASIAVRVGAGRWADRPAAPTVRATSVLLVVGGAGATVLALPVPPAVAVGAAVALLGAGWGWTGLAFLSAVRAHAGAPAVAAGVVLTGLGLGGAGGPAAFGAVASRVSYGAAWTATGVVLAAGAAVAALSDRR